MENVNLNYIHVCDTAFFSEMGKLNIIGIFKKIFAKKCPATHPIFSVVASFFITGLEGNIKKKIALFDEGNNQIGDCVEFNLDISKKQDEINSVSTFANMTFPKFGKYNIKVFLNDNLVAACPIEVVSQ